MKKINRMPHGWNIYCLSGLLLGLFLAFRSGEKGWRSVGFGVLGLFAGCLLYGVIVDDSYKN